MLEGAHHESSLITRKYGLGAVAVMNIEIDQRDSLQSVMFQRMHRCNRHIIENAKTHGAIARGVVPRRSHAAKCRARLAPNYQVRGQYRGAGRAHRGIEAARTHRRIRIQMHDSRFG